MNFFNNKVPWFHKFIHIFSKIENHIKLYPVKRNKAFTNKVVGVWLKLGDSKEKDD